MLFSPCPSQPAMHLPDGFLSLGVSLILWLITGGVLMAALKRSDYRQTPLMGVLAAYIFAAQMLNFPVMYGTSGHFVGAALATLLLGSWSEGVLVMTAVIAVQALFFQDGGLLSMGANIFNMGILPSLIAYAGWSWVRHRQGYLAGALTFLVGFLGVIGGALSVSLEMVLSGTARARWVIPAMLSVHALIGIGEGVITALAYPLFRRAVLPRIGSSPPEASPAWAWTGLLLGGLVAVLSPLASAFPDGLERVTASLHLPARQTPNPLGWFPDYTVPLVSHPALSTILAGLIGVSVVVGLFFVFDRTRRRMSSPREEP